ncbi:MAG TPA: FHA domain-containing protein [Desulfuromonadaceae bacterium]
MTFFDSPPMPMLRIPAGTLILPPRTFTRQVLANAMEELCTPRRNFTGFLSIGSGDTLHLLFLFQSRPYAAGKTVADKPSPLTIREFFLHADQLGKTAATISIHACDPVLLKSLLVFVQGDPAAKAPASLVNLEAILDQIRRDETDSLVILERGQILNLFYFREGRQGMSYFSDPDFHEGEGLPVDEQLLLYAFQSPGEVNVLIYRNVATREAADAQFMDRGEMLGILGGQSGGGREAGADAPVVETAAESNLVLEILNGPLKGQRLSGPIPGVLGRTDADIIVADPSVSPHHASIQTVNDTPMLVDLNSATGTTLNGTHVVQHPVSEGDIIGLGATALRVVRLVLS